MFSRAVYIGLHSDESYFCVRIVSKPLGEFIMLNPVLKNLHSMGKKKNWGRAAESFVLAILLLHELIHKLTCHKMKEKSFCEKENISVSKHVQFTSLDA